MAITAATIALVGGAISAGIGASSAAKTRASNEALAEQARSDELERRSAAAREAERLIDEFNELREERPDVSIEGYLRDIVNTLGDEDAREAFESATKADFANAQLIADEASQANVDVFELMNEQVSGGRAADFLRERNRLIDETNSSAAFDRALQLRAPAIGAGTVQVDKDGNFIEGQRADRQVFQTAFEVSEAQRDKKYSRLTDAIASDRTVAERQRERAVTFLPTTDFTSTSIGLVGESRAAQAAFQALDEERQFGLIQTFLGAAASDQTGTPTFGSTAAADKLTSEGISTALRGAGQLTIGSGG